GAWPGSGRLQRYRNPHRPRWAQLCGGSDDQANVGAPADANDLDEQCSAGGDRPAPGAARRTLRGAIASKRANPFDERLAGRLIRSWGSSMVAALKRGPCRMRFPHVLAGLLIGCGATAAAAQDAQSLVAKNL